MIQIIDKPNQHVMTMVYNKTDSRIAEIMDLEHGYHVIFFKKGTGGDYWPQMRTYTNKTYACAFMAAKAFAESGEVSQ